MIRLVLQRGWKSNCEGSRQEAEGPEGRLHRRARQEMMVYEEVQWQAGGEVLGWKKVSK